MLNSYFRLFKYYQKENWKISSVARVLPPKNNIVMFECLFAEFTLLMHSAHLLNQVFVGMSADACLHVEFEGCSSCLG